MDHEGIAAIREFYEENRQALFTYALALTRHRAGAEDAVHDAICRLLSRSQLPTELRPYAFRCVRNAAIDALRKERPYEEMGIIELQSADADTFEQALCSQIERFLFDLPPDEMETIVLHIIDGFSFREIASVKGTPLNTAASWYRRGVTRLRARIKGDSPCESLKTS